MNTFRSKCIYWGLLVLASMFIMVLGLRVVHNGTAVNIYYIYSAAVKDVILLILIIPIIFLMVIHEIDSFMTSSFLLALDSRLAWWLALKRKLIVDCFISATVIILPTFLMINIFTGIIKTSGEWIYMLFLFLTYFMYFLFLSLCIAALEIKFHQSLLAFSIVLLISFLPNMLSFIFRQLRIPSISGLLNLSYAFDKDIFYGTRCISVCVVLLFLFILAEQTDRALFKNQDIYWK